MKAKVKATGKIINANVYRLYDEDGDTVYVPSELDLLPDDLDLFRADVAKTIFPTMAAIKKEELIRIIHKGYCAALASCFDNQQLYAKGFFDGMKFQKDVTIPKSNFDKMLEKYEND